MISLAPKSKTFQVLPHYARCEFIAIRLPNPFLTQSLNKLGRRPRLVFAHVLGELGFDSLRLELLLPFSFLNLCCALGRPSLSSSFGPGASPQVCAQRFVALQCGFLRLFAVQTTALPKLPSLKRWEFGKVQRNLCHGDRERQIGQCGELVGRLSQSPEQLVCPCTSAKPSAIRVDSETRLILMI